MNIVVSCQTALCRGLWKFFLFTMGFMFKRDINRKAMPLDLRRQTLRQDRVQDFCTGAPKTRNSVIRNGLTSLLSLLTLLALFTLLTLSLLSLLSFVSLLSCLWYGRSTSFSPQFVWHLLCHSTNIPTHTRWLSSVHKKQCHRMFTTCMVAERRL